MKNFIALGAIAVAMLTSGCHKIYYHNGGPLISNKSAALVNEWHHDGVIGLVEFSEPVNLKGYCSSAGWSTVETENSFLTGLVSAITYALYTPREANVVCSK
jgi:hypothetical protein